MCKWVTSGNPQRCNCESVIVTYGVFILLEALARCEAVNCLSNNCMSFFLFPTGSSFNLKVQVSDVLSRQPLNQAVVDVWINYTKANRALTGEDGSVLLDVPYRTGLPITIMVSKDGYINTLLPCTTSRMPSKMC